MGFLYAILMVLALLLTPTCTFIYMQHMKQEALKSANTNKISKPTISEKEARDILYGMIEREWTYRVKFHYKLKDIRIPNFEIELEYLVKRVIGAIAPGLMSDLTYYYKEDDIIQLVSHISQILLLEYIDENRPRSSHVRT